jgi:hypothetical protein
VAGLLAVGGAVWWLAPKPQGAEDLNRAPDLLELPALGPAITLDGLVAGNFDQTGFLDLVDGEIGFAYGLPAEHGLWYEGYAEERAQGEADAARLDQANQEYNSCLDQGEPPQDQSGCASPEAADYQAYPGSEPGHQAYWDGFWGGVPTATPENSPDSLAAIAAFDLDSGEPLWQLDLEAELGLERRNGHVAPTVLAIGSQAFAVVASQTWDSGGQQVLATTDRSGKILARQVHRGPAWTATAAGDRVIWETVGEMIAAYTVEDLATPVWQHAQTEALAAYQTFNDTTGAHLILTETGLVDAISGQRLPFGQDSGEGSGVWYQFAHGGQDALFRIDQTRQTLTRVDLASGEALWDTAWSLDQDVAVGLYIAGGDLAVLGAHAADAPAGLSLADARSGKVRRLDTSQALDYWVAGPTTGCLIAQQYPDWYCVDWQTLQANAISLPTWDGAWLALGQRLVYLAGAECRLTAFDTEPKLAQAWSLAIPPPGQDSCGAGDLSLDWAGGRLFALTYGYDGSASLTELRPN